MTLERLQQEWLPVIETNLKKEVHFHHFGRSQALREMLSYHLGWETGPESPTSRGKRIRPLLTLLTAGAFLADPADVMPAAISIELLHNFTLIHDDIEDRSPLRHRRYTLWKQWGIAQAINAGDALFSIAQLAMLRLDETTNPNIALKAAEKLNQVCLHLTRGQYLDIAFETDDSIDVDTYLDMIQGKTAALVAFSAWAGGLVAQCHEPDLDMLHLFGENLGLAFQMQDDYLGVWGDPKVTGKSAASDLLSRKISLPVLYGIEHCPEFYELWKQPSPDEARVKKMAVLLEDCGAGIYVKTLSENHTQQAFTSLKKLFPQQNDYANGLNELTLSLLQRES